jgi:hypothetical protein
MIVFLSEDVRLRRVIRRGENATWMYVRGEWYEVDLERHALVWRQDEVPCSPLRQREGKNH